MTGAIVVGLDASTPSRSALTWSVRRARATGAHLDLLHVIDREWMPEPSPEVVSEATAFVQAELAYARSLDASVQMSATIAEGRPAEVLTARSKGYSLLVVGTHKTGFIYGRTFGSRFLGLGWRAHCDVAFIPDRIGRDRGGVIAGVDDSATGDAVVLFAAAEAARDSHELIIVSGWGSAGHPSTSDAATARRSAALARALDVATKSQDRLRVRTRSPELPTAEALIEASAGTALLVIGRRRGTWGTSSARAVNLDVLLNMSSPVIVVLAS